MADTQLTKQQMNIRAGHNAMNRFDAAFNANMFNRGGGSIPGIMAFMGVPNLAGGPQRRGQYGGTQGIMQNFYGAGGGGGNKPGTGGNDPSVDPNDPDAKMLKVGLPQWWVDWLHTSGQYGGVPPQGGLLD